MVQGLNIWEVCRKPVSLARELFARWEFSGRQAAIAEPLVDEILSRMRFLEQVGLGYLHLDRGADTLSGGEAQRIRLAAQLGSNLRGVCYILDEPTIGLHRGTTSGFWQPSRILREKGTRSSWWSTTRRPSAGPIT